MYIWAHELLAFGFPRGGSSCCSGSRAAGRPPAPPRGAGGPELSEPSERGVGRVNCLAPSLEPGPALFLSFCFFLRARGSVLVSASWGGRSLFFIFYFFLGGEWGFRFLCGGVPFFFFFFFFSFFFPGVGVVFFFFWGGGGVQVSLRGVAFFFGGEGPGLEHVPFKGTGSVEGQGPCQKGVRVVGREPRSWACPNVPLSELIERARSFVRTWKGRIGVLASLERPWCT